MRLEIKDPGPKVLEPMLENAGELDVISLLTTTVALFGLALVSVLSLLNVIVG